MKTDLMRALERVGARYRRVRLWGGLAVCWLFWAAVVAALGVMADRPGNEWLNGASTLGWLACLGVVSAVICAWLSQHSARDSRWVARQLERRHPELATGLLAAVDEDEAVGGGTRTYLQSAVIGHVLHHRRRHDWESIVSPWSIRGAELAHAIALGALILAASGIVREVQSRPSASAKVATSADGSDVQVEPGDASLERGTTLLVVARFGGRVPVEANLVVEDAQPSPERREMARSLEDPTFAGRVESVEKDLAYHVEYDGRRSPTYHVRVFEYPELQRTDAKLEFPAYTALPTKTVEDVRHVTAVEGTSVTFRFRLNKEVAAARLIDEKGQTTELAALKGKQGEYAVTLTLQDPKRYKVQLVDRDGRRNKKPAELAVNVTRNHTPVIAITQPGRDVRVSPVEELRLKAKMEDDFGLIRHGVSFALAGEDPRDVVLNDKAPAPRTVQADHLLAFESLHAVPDQLVTYFFWAEDYGPDGKPRRTSGDMYFAEVRHFEEIFRQGEQPPGNSAEQENQQNGNAERAQKLAELQKEIINASWKVLRAEKGASPSEKFADDGKLLKSSQHDAIEQAGEMAEQLEDRQSKANLEKATRFMKDAETQLSRALDQHSVTPLIPALAAEQSAYQALLKLRAREFEITRRNARQQRNSRAGGGSPSQQQLNELELNNDENRYEQQKSARSQQENQTQREREQAENRQVSSRLRELARRQNDLNERLKELQAALEAAKTAEAREELTRQLKRLREQQQQVLRDADELRERMEREENRDRMADARQQMEQSREHVRQASEALEQGRVAQALTEGTRAGREMNQLRDELRKQASNRFSEEMTEMRGDARQLDEQQTKLSEQLDAWNKRNTRSLRDASGREEVKKGLEQQQKKLEELVDRMRRTVQEAEEPEPLLAKELFDTVRKADENKVSDALKVAEELADAGVASDAARSSRRAGEGIGQLREGVERAAQRVLGDDTAALKRAEQELNTLSEEVDRELAQATGGAGERGSVAQRDRERESRAPGEPGSRQGDQPAGKGQNEVTGQSGGSGRRRPQGLRGDRRDAQETERQPRQDNSDGQQPPNGEPQGQRGEGPQQGERGGQPAERGENRAEPGAQGGQPAQRGRGSQPQGQEGGQRGGDRADQPRGGAANRQPGLDRVMDGLQRGGGPGNPITGGGFRQWTERMRDVEELIEEPEMRAEAARIRDRVRGEREEFKRHAKEPDWRQVRTLVANPLHELRARIAEEVRRRETPDALVPIDRDPVPPQFAEGVRRYYERLGGGR